MHGGNTQARTAYAPGSPTPGAMQYGGLPTLGNVTAGGLGIPIAIIVLLGLYVTWTFVHQHERVQSELEPKTIAANLHNLALIGLSAIVALLFLKLATAKIAIMTGWQWAQDLAAVVGAA